ncbi:MAG: hypothetical protein ACREEM_29970 [Blastocatellia bacterium]
MLFIFQEESSGVASEFLRFFIDPNYLDAPGAEDVALNWVIAGTVIAMVLMAVMELGKWLRKERAALTHKRWPLLRVFGWTFLGWAPVFAIIWLFYYFNTDFKMVMGVGGFFKGVLFAWLSYFVLMIVVDFIIPRFRSDYGK